jgi:hypothetical protein
MHHVFQIPNHDFGQKVLFLSKFLIVVLRAVFAKKHPFFEQTLTSLYHDCVLSSFILKIVNKFK